jgi:uncharacterized repeat protein (TIGR04052 family)
MQKATVRPDFLLRIGALLLPCVLLAAGCTARMQPVEIPFGVHIDGESVDCTQAANGVRLSDLRLFIHDVRLVARSGETVGVTLRDVPPWQGDQVALLDFEDGTGACRNGTAGTNTVVQGDAPDGDYAGLAFRIGIPESLNHANPLQAAPPLDHTAMHWHWLTGYKFLRAGFAGDSDHFWIHLGSTRCGGTASEPQGCRNANQPHVTLPDFVPGRSLVVLDLRALATAGRLGDGESTNCSSGPTEASCEQPFNALGLDFASGEPTGTPGLFRVTKLP